MICRLYVALCRKHLPGGWTLSARAHMRAQAGRPWWRDRIDGFWLLFFSQHRHCRHHHRADKRHLNDAKGPRA